MHKFLLTVFILLFSFGPYAQDTNDEEYKKKILNELGVEDKSEPEPEPEVQANQQRKNVFSTKDRPGGLDTYDPETGQDLAQNQNQDLEQNVDDTIEELANMGGMNKEGETVKVPVKKDVPKVKLKESYLTKMMNAQTKSLVANLMTESPFAGMQRKELEAVFMAKNEGNPLGSLLKRNEKVKNIILDVLQHEKALPNIVGLLNKPEKMKYMGIFVAVVLALAFLFNLYNSKGSIFKRILFKFGIGIGAGIANLSCFIFLFHEELTPTISIIFKYYNLG